jgi:hypothetical protein
MFQQKGGVKLTDTSLTGFEPIQQMLDSPGAQVKVLTASSLKGFMLTLDVQRGNSKYLTQTKTDKRFKTEATSFILKYVVITADAGEPLLTYNGGSKPAKKASESAESFYNEAILQQEVWETSVQTDKESICPPVANLSMFDHQRSIELLRRQNASYPNNPVLDYLLKEVEGSTNNGDYTIGILTMPKIKSETLYDFLDKHYSDVHLLEKMYSSAIAKLVRLFVDSTKTFHFDLHGGNVLVMDDGECIIIDFGNAFRFAANNKEEQDSLFEKCATGTREQINALLNDCHTFSNTMFKEYFGFFEEKEKDKHKDDVDKIRYIESVLSHLKYYEKKITDFVYGKPYFQMSWVNGVNDKGMDANEIYLNAFNMLGIKPVRDSSHTQKYYRELRRGNPIENKVLTSLPPLAPRLVTPSPTRPLIANVPKTSNGGEWVCKMVAGAAVCTFVAGKAFGLFGGKSKRNKRKRTHKTKRRR